MPPRSPAPSPAPARSAKTPATTARAPAKVAATGPSGQEPGARPATRLAVGDRAPEFTLAADDGQTYALKDLRGRRVVLYFYPRDATPGCTTEACDFRDRQPAFAGAGATVFGVSGDDLKSHARFRSKHALSFPLLSDPDHAVATAYGAYGEKVLYGKKSVGILRSTFVIGPDGAVEAVWQPVKVPGHAEAVLAAVTAAPRR
jgi:peroxiredoxin Q/BCP